MIYIHSCSGSNFSQLMLIPIKLILGTIILMPISLAASCSVMLASNHPLLNQQYNICILKYTYFNWKRKEEAIKRTSLTYLCGLSGCKYESALESYYHNACIIILVSSWLGTDAYESTQTFLCTNTTSNKSQEFFTYLSINTWKNQEKNNISLLPWVIYKKVGNNTTITLSDSSLGVEPFANH